MSPTPTGNGYWLVASDGGIFAYGDANFFGSTGSIKLNQPITSMTATSTGNGYWLVGADGGIFSYGDAPFYGAIPRSDGTVAVAIMKDNGTGYKIARTDGTLEQHSGPQDITPNPASSTPNPGTGAPVDSSGWALRKQDDFNGGSLNISTWGVYNGSGNEGVGYRVPSQVSVGNGELTINGSGLNGGGICWCGSGTGGPTTYGRWEVRARMDAGTGYGPAILLWPSSERWPIDGEIDITEMPEGARNKSHFTVHYGANNSQTGYTSTGDFTQWHTYTVEWMPDHITYWLDGVQQYTTTNAAAIPRTPMHLAIQNDVGAAGHWIPGRDASTPANVALHVDYIKIYNS